MDTDGDPDCLDYIWVRGAVRVVVGPARLRPARSRGPDALPERPPRASPRSSRSGRRAGGRAGPSGSRIAATGGAPRRTRSRRCAGAGGRRPATASSSTSGRRPTGSRSSSTTTTLARVQGRPEAVDALTAAALGELGVPTPRRRARRGRPPGVPRRRAQAVPGPGVVEILAAGRGPELTGAVVCSFDQAALVEVGRLAPSWPRWLNTHRSTRRPRRRRSSSAAAASRSGGRRSIRRPWTAPRAGPGGGRLDRARAATFDRLAASGSSRSAWRRRPRRLSRRGDPRSLSSSRSRRSTTARSGRGVRSPPSGARTGEIDRLDVRGRQSGRLGRADDGAVHAVARRRGSAVTRYRRGRRPRGRPGTPRTRGRRRCSRRSCRARALGRASGRRRRRRR